MRYRFIMFSSMSSFIALVVNDNCGHNFDQEY